MKIFALSPLFIVVSAFFLLKIGGKPQQSNLQIVPPNNKSHHPLLLSLVTNWHKKDEVTSSQFANDILSSNNSKNIPFPVSTYIKETNLCVAITNLEDFTMSQSKNLEPFILVSLKGLYYIEDQQLQSPKSLKRAAKHSTNFSNILRSVHNDTDTFVHKRKTKRSSSSMVEKSSTNLILPWQQNKPELWWFSTSNMAQKRNLRPWPKLRVGREQKNIIKNIFLNPKDIRVVEPILPAAASITPLNLIGVRPIKYAVPLLGYAGTGLVFFTLITNSFIVIVLLHKHMRTPTNTVLACMALSDMLTGLFPLPWMIHFYLLGNYAKPVNEFWCQYYYLGVVHIPTIFHTASIWLITSLAIQRYMYVCYSSLAKTWCTISKVLMSVVIIYLISTLNNLPRVFEHEIEQIYVNWDTRLSDWGYPNLISKVKGDNDSISSEGRHIIQFIPTTANHLRQNAGIHSVDSIIVSGAENILKPGIYWAKDLAWFGNISKEALNIAIRPLPQPSFVLHKSIGQFQNLTVDLTNLKFKHHCGFRSSSWLVPWENVFYNLYFWFRVVFVHVVPCTTLVVLNGLLIHAMRNAMERRKRLLKTKKISTSGRGAPNLLNEEYKNGKSTSKSPDLNRLMEDSKQRQSIPLTTTSDTAKAVRKSKNLGGNDERKIRDTNATTYMLILVVSVFLIVEIPLGIMFILHIIENTFNLPIIDYKFALSLMTITDFFILASYPVNFFIYCFMSKQFRDTFQRFFSYMIVRPFAPYFCCGARLNQFTVFAKAEKLYQQGLLLEAVEQSETENRSFINNNSRYPPQTQSTNSQQEKENSSYSNINKHQLCTALLPSLKQPKNSKFLAKIEVALKDTPLRNI